MGDSTNDDSIPALEGDAAVAVEHEGTHIQIIAAAGSGKTEVVSQRVAALIAKGVEPAVIVAFTFTEKAAAELKERIRQRVTARVGQEASDKLGQLRVSTIHAFCFRLLQTFRPEFESYSLIDENQLVALMQREANRIGVRKFDASDRLFAGIDAFLRSVDVIENELIPPADIPEGDFKDSLKIYYETLARYRVLTFGQQIAETVRILEDPVVHAAATAQIAHLIVDEYQGRETQHRSGSSSCSRSRWEAPISSSSATTTRRSISGAGRTSRTSSLLPTGSTMSLSSRCCRIVDRDPTSSRSPMPSRGRSLADSTRRCLPFASRTGPRSRSHSGSMTSSKRPRC